MRQHPPRAGHHFGKESPAVTFILTPDQKRDQRYVNEANVMKGLLTVCFTQSERGSVWGCEHNDGRRFLSCQASVIKLFWTL